MTVVVTTQLDGQSGGLVRLRTVAGRFLQVAHHGSYQGLGGAYEVLLRHAKVHGLKVEPRTRAVSLRDDHAADDMLARRPSAYH